MVSPATPEPPPPDNTSVRSLVTRSVLLAPVSVVTAVMVGAVGATYVFRSTPTVLPPATARSDLPSPLKSPTATEFAAVLPVEKVGIFVVGNVPFPVLNNTPTVVLLELATARSGLPSPLKSPTATEVGFDPPVP